MTIYHATVTRDGKWWMITIPELAGHTGPDGAVNLTDTTQARRLADVPAEASDLICTVTNTAPSELIVELSAAGAGRRSMLSRCDPAGAAPGRACSSVRHWCTGGAGADEGAGCRFSRMMGADGVWTAFCITEAITAAFAYLIYRKEVKKILPA